MALHHVDPGKGIQKGLTFFPAMTQRPLQPYQFKRLKTAAEAGNPKACYQLAMALSGSDIEEALRWMEKAADQDLGEAFYQLGVWHTEGILKPREMRKGLNFLQKAEEKGIFLAAHYRAVLKAKGVGQDPDWPGGLEIVTGLAFQGNPYALSQLAFLARMKGDKKIEDKGLSLLELAAFKGNPEAQYAYGAAILETDEKKGRFYIQRAAASRLHLPASKHPAFKAPREQPELSEPDLKKEIIEEISEALQKPPSPPLPEPENLTLKPLIATYTGFISPELSDYLIARAGPRLNPSQVIDHIRGVFIRESFRTSTELRFLPSESNLVIQALCHRIAAATGEPLENQEVLGVLRYKPGQEYKPHSDFLMPGPEGENPEVLRCGQRIKTFLIYLNEDFEGGETEFIKLGLKFRGHKGDGILFTNVAENGKESPLSLHAGRPVEKGEKFITTLWIRDQKFIYPLESG